MTTDITARQPLDCDHQSVCWMFRYDKKQQEGMLEFCFRKYCIHDSRATHTSPTAPVHGRWRDKENSEMMHNIDDEVKERQQEWHTVINEAVKKARVAERERVLDAGLLYRMIHKAVLFRDKYGRLPTGNEALNWMEESLRAQQGGVSE
jgi:hypothetical protein